MNELTKEVASGATIDGVIEVLMKKLYETASCEDERQMLENVYLNRRNDEPCKIELSDEYLTKCASFLKFLRHNQTDQENLPKLILNTKTVSFLKVNLFASKALQNEKSSHLKIQATWLITQFAYCNDP